MYEELVKRLRDAAKMSEALAVLLPNSDGSATAKLYNEAADAIEKLSKERKCGKWMPSSRTWSYYNYDCSVCGCNEFRQVDHNGGYKAFNFCPNCGADMREES